MYIRHIEDLFKLFILFNLKKNIIKKCKITLVLLLYMQALFLVYPSNIKKNIINMSL